METYMQGTPSIAWASTPLVSEAPAYSSEVLDKL